VLHDYPPDTVHFVRKHVPLEAHEAARPAARADVCAQLQNQHLGEALADRLVQIDLSPSANRRAALEVGVDATRFDSCMGSSEPDVRIDDDTKLLKSVGMQGLPTTYIGGKRLLGAVSEEAVRDAVEKAKSGAGNGGVSGWAYVAAVLAALGAVVWLGRTSRGTV
jgi:protein-disulfide isomerase